MSKYAPGSFSKNFAWHGTGLRKLYDAIQNGFDGKLMEVGRSQFRQRCGVPDNSLQLIPINFFLYNKIAGTKNYVAVDELVYQSLAKSHSLAFDRLALFAIHLSRGGKRRGTNGTENPTQWINEFVRKDLWVDGNWIKNKLEKPHMDSFIATVLNAQADVRVKCRTNYRHLFELCQYIPTTNSTIDSGAEDWIGSAYFLAWDRHMMDSGISSSSDRDSLLKYAEDEQIHRILGIPKEEADDYQQLIVDSYIEAECLDRFRSKEDELPKPIKSQTPDKRTRKLNRAPKKAIVLENMEDERRDEVQRRRREYDAQIRDAKLAAKLKALYAFECQFCGTRLQVGLSPDRYYAEGAHIKGLGKPDNGPDVASNLLVLCPNHHKQFDNGILLLVLVDEQHLKIVSRVEGHELHGKVVSLKGDHRIDDVFLLWHRNKWRSRDR